MSETAIEEIPVLRGTGERVLVVGESSTVRLVASKLQANGYVTERAEHGVAGLESARKDCPDLVLCDGVMPGMSGYDLARALRRDIRTAGVSVIMVVRGLANLLEGLDAGADDYVVKPFDDLELFARIKSVLRRSKDLRSISPLTGLPGNFNINDEIERRIQAREEFAVLYADLDDFKPYNDHYGFGRGDGVLKMTARLIQEVALSFTGEEVFVGHIGGDDFVTVAPNDIGIPIAEKVIERFDGEAKKLYDPEDAERGYIEKINRAGQMQRFWPVSISVGIATTDMRDFSHFAEAVAVASEMKSFTKKSTGSSWAVDRRRIEPYDD